MQNLVNSLLSEYGILNPELVRELCGEVVKETILSKYTFPKEQSSDGYYHIQVKDDTKASGRRQIKAKTLDKLSEKVLAFEREQGTRERKTVTDVFEEIMADRERYSKGDRKYSVLNTIRVYRGYFKRFFGGTDFEKMYVDNVTEADVDRAIMNALCEYDMKPDSFSMLRTLLSLIFTYAKRERYIAENPCVYLDFRSSRYRSMLINPTDIEKRLYTDEELEKLLTYARSREGTDTVGIGYYALELQILTGMRCAEVCALEWSDIRTDPGDDVRYLLIHKEAIRTYVNGKSTVKLVNHTKTYKDRKVPIWNELGEYFEKLRRADLGSGFLFPADNELGCYYPQNLFARHRVACNHCKVPISNEFRRGAHAYRRNFAKRLNNPELTTRLLGNTEKVLEVHYYNGFDLEGAKNVLDKVGVNKRVNKNEK